MCCSYDIHSQRGKTGSSLINHKNEPFLGTTDWEADAAGSVRLFSRLRTIISALTGCARSAFHRKAIAIAAGTCVYISCRSTVEASENMQSDVLKIALERGILSREQAEALGRLSDEIAVKAETARDSAFAPRNGETARPKDDEDLKFVGGFGDIFVTIGLALFLWAVAYFANKIGYTIVQGTESWCLATAGTTWVLAEYFTRKRRMALPSIVMFMIFIACTFTLFATLLFNDNSTNILRLIEPSFNKADTDTAQRWLIFSKTFAACMATAVLAGIYYWRFRVPIAVAAAAAVTGAAVIAFIATIAPEFAKLHIHYAMLVYGVAVFALAMRFDMSDPLRRTRRTDIAFWLHLLAAPLIVHPMLNPIVQGEALTVPQATLIIAVFLLLGLVAIVIDRRAVLVSSLTYAGISFSTLIKVSGVSSFVSETVPLTLLVLGGFILLISVGWHPLRRVVLSWLPGGFVRRLHNPYTPAAV
jgi:hypothetical protein